MVPTSEVKESRGVPPTRPLPYFLLRAVFATYTMEKGSGPRASKDFLWSACHLLQEMSVPPLVALETPAWTLVYSGPLYVCGE